MKNSDNKNMTENKEILQDENLQTTETETEEALEEQIDFDNLSFDEAIELLKKFYKLNSELAAKINELDEKLTAATDEAAANKDSWYRSAAEFENFKKRNVEARQSAYFDGKKDAICSLLVIGDSVDRALAVELDEKTRAGVTLIKKQFEETLAALSVVENDPVGQQFDPETAEAIATVEAAEGEQSNTVKTVYKKGYTLNGKILRYAQVIVIK